MSSRGDCGQQHPVAGLQAAAAAQRGGNRDVGAGGQGDHAARVAAGGHHARVGGQGQPVTAGQPSALMTARSAIRPEASMRPIP